MSEPIISVSGLRGTIGDQLTPVVAARYVAALATTLPKGSVVVARDGRESGAMLTQVILATLAANGLNAIDLGVAATPTVGIEVKEHAAVAGVQISASHNPRQYNGIKLFGPDGRVLTKAKGEAVLAAYAENRAGWVSVDDLGQITQCNDPHAAHLARVLATVDVEGIRQRKLRVLLDSNHGAGSLLGSRLLEDLGCDVTLLGDLPNGKFAHTPEPIAENLTSVCSVIASGEFDVGFCQDPDADRLAVIDQHGVFIGEELTLALCLLQALPATASKGQVGNHRSTIVTNCATSSLSRILADRFGCSLKQSAVGEANVADLMIAENAVFGGEGNGGPIDPRVGLVRDSFVGMARILDLLTTSGLSVSELVASLPPLAMAKDKMTISTNCLPGLFDALTVGMPGAQASEPDGLKLDWGDRWLLVRGSNTEPIVRFIAEAPTTSEAQSLCDAARQVAQAMQ
ncbi:MAG: phosphoglucosamine mutase [Planctomycetales bacterium]|nr:phosphoglucosamine mutase [Planctomycetales bacterium]